MDTRGYFQEETAVTLPVPTGSAYVASLIAINTASVVKSALNEAHHMMDAAVAADGSIKDEYSLSEVRKCMGVALTHFELLATHLGLPSGTQVQWGSGYDQPLTGTITRTYNRNGIRQYTVVENNTNDVYTMVDTDFEVI